jgi:hypothetical protein
LIVIKHLPQWGKAVALAIGLLPLQSFSASTAAVVATDHCDQPSTALRAKNYHQALGAHLGEDLLTEREVQTRLGAPPQQLSLGEIERLLTGVTADVFQDQTDRAMRTLTGVADDVERLPPSEARYRVRLDVLALLGHIHLKLARSDRSHEAIAAQTYERILRVEPLGAPTSMSIHPRRETSSLNCVRA